MESMVTAIRDVIYFKKIGKGWAEVELTFYRLVDGKLKVNKLKEIFFTGDTFESNNGDKLKQTLLDLEIYKKNKK